MSPLAHIVFWIAAAAAGGSVAVHLLKLKSLSGVIALSFVLPIAFLIFTTNALGYAMPFWTAAVTSYALLLLAGIGGYAFRRGHAAMLTVDISRKAIGILALLTVLAGIAVMRIPGSDPWFWAQYPLAATIAEGNFPVMEPGNPWNHAEYHYGPQLLAAAVHLYTNASFEALFAMQVFIGIAGLLFGVYALMRKTGYGGRTAFWAALLSFFGGSVLWLYIIPIAGDFLAWSGGGADLSPFRRIVFLYSSNVVSPLFTAFFQRSTALGYPLFFGLLYVLSQALSASGRAGRAGWIITGVICGAALGLVMETGLILLLAALACYCLFIWIHHLRYGTYAQWRGVWVAAFLIAIPSLVLMVMQGGVLSHTAGEAGPAAFALYPDWAVVTSLEGERIAFWHWKFLIAFGLPFLLSVAALPSVWRKKREQPLMVLLVLILGIHLVLPFFVHYTHRPSELIRLFFGAYAIMGVLSAVFLHEYSPSMPGFWKKFLLFAMLFSSVLFACVRFAFPTLEPETSPLLGRLPEPTGVERSFYEWVREHTSLQDYFYVRSAPRPEDGMLDADLQDVYLFMIHARRFAIADLSVDSFPAAKVPLLTAIESSCDAQAFAELSLSYLVVVDEARAAWFEQTCNPADWSLIHDASNGDITYPRLYALRGR